MDMARKKHRAEEIIPKLRAMEVHIANGLKTDEAARKEGSRSRRTTADVEKMVG